MSRNFNCNYYYLLVSIAFASGVFLSASLASPRIMPNSTSLTTGESVSFHVSGGMPPYRFEVIGVGSIDSFGNFQAGMSTGQSQIQVSDANGNSSLASVSVVQTGPGG